MYFETGFRLYGAYLELTLYMQFLILFLVCIINILAEATCTAKCPVKNPYLEASNWINSTNKN